MVERGTVFDGRYEITGRIGAGGMSDVYKALDHKLNRSVAVKILKSEYSEDRNFVSKFHVEAQSAAILMHPNIVNVYDVGEEMGLHYIVMELVEGITLKEYIEKKLRLSFKETISIAIQVSMGIESAHNKHIIHRDIKPQNIMISKDGKVKVTDFGIARAASKNTVTSNVMGSVHYTSPEQARGSYSDAKSDIYSLGITMFEMLTGRVPFDGETTVGIAVKHIQEPLPSPRDYVDDIPISAEQIIYKCCEKNPAKRYQSMGELVADLKQSLVTPDASFVKFVDIDASGKTQMVTKQEMQNIRKQTEPISLPEDMDIVSMGRPIKTSGTKRPYPGSSYIPEDSPIYEFGDQEYKSGYEKKKSYEEYPEEDYEDPYEEYPEEEYGDSYEEYPEEEYEDSYGNEGYVKRREGSSRKKKPAAKKQKPSVKKDKNTKPEKKQTQKSAAKKPAKKPVSKAEEFEDDGDDIDPGMERIMSILSILAALVIAIIVIFLISKALGIFSIPQGVESVESESTGEVSVPAVTGMSYEAAKEKLKDLGLTVSAVYESSSMADKEQVIGQSIEEGETVSAGTLIELTVSSGGGGISIPDVIGKSEAEARVALEAEGFVMVSDESSSDSVEKGDVISQNPAAGDTAQKGATVTVMISTGRSDSAVTVPDIRLKSEDEALALLAEAGLSGICEEQVANAVVPKDCVISQTYSPGVSVAAGTTVSYTLSSGPEGDAATGQLYKCSLSVTAPSNYTGGTAVVSLTQSGTGTVLFQTAVTSFPVAINLTNISGSDTAVLTVAYQIQNTYITENEDGTTNSRTTSEDKTESKQITLTPQ